MKEVKDIKRIIEGAIFAAETPLNVNHLLDLFAEAEEKPEKALIKEALEALTEDYQDRGLELKNLASGYRFQVRVDLAPWIKRLWEERPPRYSRALLETLVLIAYRQPVTRGEIEEIRGVSVSSNIVRTLIDRDWVREVGVKDVPGRPALLATTSQFLDYFGLSKLEALPTLDEIRDLEEQGHQLEAQLQLQARQAMEEDLASDEDVPDAHSEDDVEATFVEDEEVDENNEQIEVVEMHED